MQGKDRIKYCTFSLVYTFDFLPVSFFLHYCLPACISIHLSAHLSVCDCMYVCLTVCLLKLNSRDNYLHQHIMNINNDISFVYSWYRSYTEWEFNSGFFTKLPFKLSLHKMCTQSSALKRLVRVLFFYSMHISFMIFHLQRLLV